jgi:hypothetical protein
VGINVVNGSDAQALFASIVDSQFTGNPNEYVYLGEVLYAPVAGVGTYNVEWAGTLPMLSSSAGPGTAILGGFFDTVGSDVLVSFAEYAPPKSTNTQFVALLTKMVGANGKVVSVLDAEVEELAPVGIQVAPGGTLTPSYYLERREGDSPDNWTSDEILSNASIVIPPDGLSGLVVNMTQLPAGTYTLEVQVADAFENESDVLEFAISVGQAPEAPQIAVELTTSSTIKVSWPGAASNYTLQTSPTLPAAVWTDVPPNQIVTDGPNKSFTDTIAGSTRFYRLRPN